MNDKELAAIAKTLGIDPTGSSNVESYGLTTKISLGTVTHENLTDFRNCLNMMIKKVQEYSEKDRARIEIRSYILNNELVVQMVMTANLYERVMKVLRNRKNGE